jgi:anti-sigma-K factor RskA
MDAHDDRIAPDLAHALARAVDQVEPPAALRARVLTSVAGAAPSRPEAPARALPAWLAMAALVAITAGVAIYAAQLRSRIAMLESQLHEAILRADAGTGQLAEIRRTADEAQSTIAVLTAPDLVRVELAGQAVAPRASARTFLSRSRGMVFTATNLPALPAGRIYQLWVVTPQAPVSAGLLRPDASGGVNVRLTAPPNLGAPVAVAVTIEPDGGVPLPTGDKYLVGAVSPRAGG